MICAEIALFPRSRSILFVVWVQSDDKFLPLTSTSTRSPTKIIFTLPICAYKIAILILITCCCLQVLRESSICFWSTWWGLFLTRNFWETHTDSVMVCRLKIVNLSIECMPGNLGKTISTLQLRSVFERLQWRATTILTPKALWNDVCVKIGGIVSIWAIGAKIKGKSNFTFLVRHSLTFCVYEGRIYLGFF